MSEKISPDDFMRWSDIRTAAEGDMLAAIKKLRRLKGFTYAEILGLFTLHLYKDFRHDPDVERRAV